MVRRSAPARPTQVRELHQRWPSIKPSGACLSVRKRLSLLGLLALASTMPFSC
jgi:hypothetical protein